MIKLKKLLKRCLSISLNFEIFNKLKIPLPYSLQQQELEEQLDNIYENEIENSKKTIEGLEKSIENIMKNTGEKLILIYYKLSDITKKL